MKPNWNVAKDSIVSDRGFKVGKQEAKTILTYMSMVVFKFYFMRFVLVSCFLLLYLTGEDWRLVYFLLYATNRADSIQYCFSSESDP